MKTATLFIVFLAFLSTFAQEVNYDQVIPTDSAVGLNFEEKLIRLAWKNYPQNKIWEHKAAQAEEQVIQSKNSWLKPVSVQLYYGEPHINPNFESTFFPRYNLGVNINIGDIISTPSRIREKEEEVHIAMANYNSQKHYIRSEVIRRHQKYLIQMEMLKVHIQIQEQTNNAFLDITQKFKNGRAELDEYTNSALIYNNSTERRLNSEGELKIAKAHLEELIGVPLESVL